MESFSTHPPLVLAADFDKMRAERDAARAVLRHARTWLSQFIGKGDHRFERLMRQIDEQLTTQETPK